MSARQLILVAGAVEIVGNAAGRVRLAAIADCLAETLHAFIRAGIAKGATVKTDGWSGYPGAPDFTHASQSREPWPRPAMGTSPLRQPQNAGRSASITACAATTCNPTSTNSCSASIAAKPATPPSTRCSASPSPSNTPPTKMLIRPEATAELLYLCGADLWMDVQIKATVQQPYFVS
jgi:hypothetical protein